LVAIYPGFCWCLYDGLTVLQHRGQDAAGIVTCDQRRLFLRKANGLVRDVFRTHHMLGLHGSMGIGHVRYPTAGCFSSAEAQPFYVNSPFGITLAHNGNLTNAAELKRDLFRADRRHINYSRSCRYFRGCSRRPSPLSWCLCSRRDDYGLWHCRFP